MKKKIINIILIVVVIISTILATLILTDNEQETKEEKSILTVWSDDEDISYLFDEVYGEDFEYELNWVNVSNEEMGDKIQLHLALHEPLADICILYRNSLSSINPDTTFIDLEERFQLNPDDLFNINNKALINDKGHLWAVPSTLSAAGMAYNKKLMMDYFGLENPIQVRYEFNSWADLISKGKEVKKNNPNIKMFSSLSDAAVILIGQTKQEFVVDNKLNEASRFKNFFTILKALQDEGLVGNNQMFSPSWYKSLKSDEILFFPCSLSLIQNGIFEMGKPWGFTRACSGSFNFGGTIWAISKDSENVDLAYDFLSRVLLSDAGARYAKYKENGTYIAYKPAYEIDGYRNLVVECFDNQDIGEIFFETIIDEVDAIQRGENSEAIENIFMDIVLWMMDDPDLKVDDCYAMFIERCNLLLE